ncbi:LamG-like jellyroll fold domain-containing protein [Variovorax sp. GB1P17]|uniref:LamG-like jellyroll fold domain-containing protein n=1 Tax=Variovorax sp. GB1P17 TaxID=3443740 RepID=UPI003F492F1D
MALIALLSGCGGGGGGGGLPFGSGPTGAAPAVPPAATSRKVLLIGIDGLNINQLQEAIAQQRMPALAQLKLRAAYTGGIAGTVTQQETLSGPGWATIVTGAWANRHKVNSDAVAQTPQADTLFRRLASASPSRKAAVAASNAQLVGLLQADVQGAAIDRLVDCAGVDLCVAASAEKAIANGSHDLVLANFHALAPIASTGSDSDYKGALEVLDAQVAKLLAAIQARQQANGKEEWLVLASTDRAMRAKGAPVPPPRADKTTFIALNKPANAVFNAAAPMDLYDYPSAADIAPTVLDFLGAVDADPALWTMDGQSLLGKPGVQQLRASTAPDAPKTIRLDWKLAADATPPAELRVYRDNKPVKTLPPAATAWSEEPPGLGAEGEKTYLFNYVVTADGVPLATRAEVSYVEPVDQLAPSLLDQLRTFISFDGGLGDAKGGPGLALLKPTPPTPVSYVADGFSGKALVIDPKVNSYVMPIDWTGRAQFTLGFWFNSDAKQAWLPVVTNKNWASGANPGFIASQTDSPNALTFNFGDGKQRADATLSIPSDQWVYIALSVDTVAKKATAYVGNPGQKLQSAALDLAALDMAKALPAGPLVFNEDATGKFYSGYAIGKVAPKYNDVAMWNRLLTTKEITMLYSAGKSLTTLNP